MSAPLNGAPRVTYWTGVWEPQREAISKEVAWLRRSLSPGSPVISFTGQPTAIHPRDRVLRINRHHWYMLRAAALGLEPLGRVTHVFGGVGTTEFFLRILGRRPILFTVVIPSVASEPDVYARVDHFVAESRSLRDILLRAGVPADRIDVIYPAVDLRRYAPLSAPHGRFTLLFASSPPDVNDIDTRGIGLLIELARARPGVDVVVLWRQWGDADEAARVLAARRPPANFRIQSGDVADMAAAYQQAHATVCFFEAGNGKSAPNSVVEGLACGRPTLLSDTCGIADLVTEWDAGAVAPRQLDALLDALDRLQSRYDIAASQARRLAEAEFDRSVALGRYAGIYARLAGLNR
jgi:glycosyltransferase involved in cell wall biosynthesis